MADASQLGDQARPPRTQVPALVRASLVLDALAESEHALTFGELAARVNLPRSSLHDICSTLVSTRLAERSPEGAYSVGVRVVELARAWLRGSGLVTAFQDAVRQADLKVTVVLSVLTDHDTVPVAIGDGGEAVGMRYEVGRKVPAAFSATGKAILATYADNEVRRILSDDMTNYLLPDQSKTIDSLLAELEESRSRGLAISDEELARGVACVAAPVFESRRAEAVGAVSACFVKSTTSWFDLSAGDQVRAIARETSRMLGATTAW